jgi:integrase
MKGSNRRKRQNGLYRRNRGIFCFRYKDKNAVWREKSTGFTDREQALDFKKKHDEDNSNDDLPSEKAKWPVEQACRLWVENHKLSSVRAKSNERSLLRQLTRVLGPKKLDAITLDDLKGYQVRRGEVEGKGNRTINLELRILMRVLKEENLWKRKLKENYKPLPESDGEVGQALTIEQLEKLQQTAATNDRWMVAYYAQVLAANSGMRGGEIRKTTIGAVDLQNARIYIRRKATKTNKGARVIELNPQAQAAVARLCQRAERLGATAPDHFLLPADLSRHVKDGDPLKGGKGFDPTRHQQTWRTAWLNLREEAGLANVRFHDLRHTFITRLAENNVPLPVVRSMVGHMSQAVTERYTHISTNAARAAVELLGKIHPQANFVDVFVDGRKSQNGKLLEMKARAVSSAG